MLNQRYLYFLILCAIAGSACYYFSAYGFPNNITNLVSDTGPRIVFPSSINLGSRESGAIVVPQIHIENRGDADLYIDEIRASNCSCTGLERMIDGKLSRVASLVLRPQEIVELSMRLTVPADSLDGKSISAVDFRSNDSKNRYCRTLIEIEQITGGVICEPNIIAFGALQIGSRHSQVVTLRDRSKSSKKIASVTSSDPGQVQIMNLNLENSAATTRTDISEDIVGRFEVIPNTSNPCYLNATINVALNGREHLPDKVQCYGRVVPAIELFPSIIALPRFAATGNIYEATCTCKNTRGLSMELNIQEKPDFITIDLESTDAPHLLRLKIKWDQNKYQPLNGQERKLVRLIAHTSGEQFQLELPILLRASYKTLKSP